MFDVTEFYVPRKCTECGEEISDLSVKGLCKRCWNRLYQQKKREQRVLNGLCPKCGNPKSDDGFRECESCREKWRQYCRERRSVG